MCLLQPVFLFSCKLSCLLVWCKPGATIAVARASAADLRQVLRDHNEAHALALSDKATPTSVSGLTPIPLVPASAFVSVAKVYPQRPLPLFFHDKKTIFYFCFDII